MWTLQITNRLTVANAVGLSTHSKASQLASLHVNHALTVTIFLINPLGWPAIRMAIQPNPQAKPATEVETTHVDGDGGADTTAVAGAHVDTGVHDAGDKCPRCHKASHFQPPTFLDPGYNAAGQLMPFSEMNGVGCRINITVPAEMSNTSRVAHIIWRYCEFEENLDQGLPN